MGVGEDAVRANLLASRYDINSTVPSGYKMNIEICGHGLMNFFGTLDECEKNFHELKKSVVELVLALNPHGVRHLKASTFLDISVLGKLLPPSCIRCMSWNPEASYKKLKNLGRTHGKRLDLTKLKELGQGLTAVFDIVLKEAKNIVCEDCNESPGVDVIFDGQQMCCVINVKVR